METIKEERSEGLTLVELLVALAIFMIIVTGIVFYVMRTSQYTGRRVDVAVNIQQGTRMAMEQLTRELRQAGYNRQSDLAVGPGSNATYIEFEAALDPAVTGPQRVAYQFVSNTIQRRVGTSVGGFDTVVCPDGATTHVLRVAWGSWVTMAENVQSFTLTYARDDGAAVADPPSCDDLLHLSNITVNMGARVDNPYPGAANVPVTANLRAQIQIRNSGISSGCGAPPSIPSGLVVSDTCLCTRLTLAWAPNTDTNLAGYTILVGQTQGLYGQPIDVGKITSYTIDQNNMHLSPDIPYYVAIAAYDRCHQQSAALEVFFDNTGCGTAGDTRPSPTAPEAVDISTVRAVANNPAPGAKAGTITLTWDAIKHGGVIRDDLFGYRIYRSPDNINFTCISCTQGNPASVTLPYVSGQATYTYTDNGTPDLPNLAGCNIYYYQIVGVNCRDEGTRTASIHGDGGGPAVDFPANANTSPPDTMVPADPSSVTASAGANETWISYTTPDEQDINGILILYRSITPGTDPCIYPVISDGHDPRTLDPLAQQPADAGAYLTGVAKNQTYTFHHVTGVVNNTRYCYRVYTFDKCNNFSPGAASSAEALPCGDAIPTTWYHGAPGAPTNLTTRYCADKVYLSWVAPVGPGGEVTPDLMLYRVYRDGSPLSPDVTASLTYTDSGIDPNAPPGTSHTYQVSAIDCANNEGPKSNAVIAYPGQVIVDHSNNALFFTSGPNHNQVFFLVRNTSGALATIQSMSLFYDQTAAFIQEVDFYTIQTVSPLAYTLDKQAYLATGAPTIGSGGTIPFSNIPQLSGQGAFPGLSYRLVRVVFADSSGDESPVADMRGVEITTTINYMLGGTNYGCTATSSLFTVPFGPIISGTQQMPPGSTFLTSTILPGSYIVPGGSDTTVQTFITTDAGADPITATLFWTTTALSVTSPPSRPFGSSISMIASGNQFTVSSPIPPQDGRRVWYYIEATDAKHNESADPTNILRAYTYDQTVIDPCTTTPKNPSSLNAVVCAPGQIRLSWAPVTKNTDNSTIQDLAGYHLYRYTDFSFTTLDPAFSPNPASVDKNTLIFDDFTDTTVNHYYKVTAFDTCAKPTPKESSLSTAPTVTSPLAGGTGFPTVTPTTTSIHPFISGVTPSNEGIYGVVIVDPQYACNGILNEVAYAHVCSATGIDEDEFRIIEQGDSGIFLVDSAFYGRSYLQAFLSSGGGGGDINLGVSRYDTITICWNRVTVPGGTGTTCSPCVASATVRVTPNPCYDVPNPPTNLTMTSSTTKGSSKIISMSWTAPTTNTDGSALADLAGYYVYVRIGATGSWNLAAGGQVGSGTTSFTYTDSKFNTYYFKVKAIDSCTSPAPNLSDDSNIIGPF